MGKRITHGVTCPFIFVYPFSDNISCSLQGFCCILYFSFDKTLHPGQQIRFVLYHDNFGKRFQPFFTCNLSLSHPFGFVGQIKVFYLGAIPGIFDSFLEFRG